MEVIIDYRETSRKNADSGRAKQLYDQGLMNCEIAQELGCCRNYVTKLLRHWFESHGQKLPDGRERRSSLNQKTAKTTKYKELAEAAKGLWDEGLAEIQIAERLECSTSTVSAAVAHWHRSRDLPVPKNEDRRQKLIDRMQTLYGEGKLIREIATEVGMSVRSVTLLLRERYASLGRTMPDGRTRRAKLANEGKPRQENE